MIYAQMGGRLGNQLFRYAAARSLQIKYYPDEQLVFDFGYLRREGSPSEGWVNGLLDFQVTDYSLHEKDGVMLHAGSILQRAVCVPYYLGLRRFNRFQMNDEHLFEKKCAKLLNHFGVYWYRTGYIELDKSFAKDKLMSGCFESPDYFKDYREILLEEFKPIKPKLQHNSNLYSAASDRQSVCLSVRRGDFESDKFKSLHSVCTEEYYLQAIDYMRKELDNPVFILFSDDVEWLRHHIRIPGVETYIERGDDPVWEKLRLMSSCSHFIISNSSFSWWSQWLGRADDKIVVSPSRWYNNDYKCPLIDESMIKICC